MTAYAHIEAIIRSGGQIMIGTVVPIRGAAVAHDGTKTLVMLRCKPQEALVDILQRLDSAIATARASGQRVDEINQASSDRRYEI